MCLISTVVLAQSWTIRTAQPDKDHHELVTFIGDSIPLKLTLSPASNFQFVPILVLDTIAMTDKWSLSFVYRGHQLISFRGVNLRIDDKLHEMRPTEQPYQRMNNLLGTDQVMEWFEIAVSDSFFAELALAKQILVEFDAARDVKEVALKKKRIEYLQVFNKFALQKRKLLIGR